MKITPLVLHGAVQVPRYTARFSTPVPVATIDVVSGGTTTLNCSSPHGVAIGSRIGVSITDAESPNGIVAAEVLASGDILLTTAFDHNLTTTPDPTRFQAWNTVCRLSGFADSNINGQRQLVEVRSRLQFVMKPGGTVASVTLGGAEKLLERLEVGLIGWHSVLAATSTTLTFSTPAAVTRSFTITAPVVVRGIRIYGARDPEAAFALYTQDGNNLAPDQAVMFVCPEAAVVAERVGGSRGGTSDYGPGSDYRQRLGDGFSVVVFLPSAGTVGHVQCIDLAQGEIFRTVLKSFNGLRVDRSEFSDGGEFSATFHAHGSASLTNKAIYSHKYDFQSPAFLTNDDAIAPWEWSDFGAMATPATDLVPIGAPALHELDFTGILHDGEPQPLFGNFEVLP